MNSFIPWVGGKSQSRNRILEKFPKVKPECYVEVFGGAGWILFSRDAHAPLEVFNDIDGNLVNLYRCIQYHCEELQREIRLGGEQIPINSREIFFDYMAQLNMRGLTDIQRAARYFYIIRISYGADRHSFCCNKNALLSAIDRLPEIQERLKSVVVENRDFEAVIKTYNKEKALLYLDPPYFKAEKHYEGFAVTDHQRLFNAIKTIKGNFLLSYNDRPEIRELYKDYTIYAFDRANSLASKNGSGQPAYKELLITNY